MYNVFFKKQIVYFSYFNDLFLQRSPVRGSVRLQHPLVQRRPPVEVVCHPVVLHKLQKLSSPYELWLSLRVPPPLPPILPKKICIRHVASKKNEVTPYHCIFRFFNLSIKVHVLWTYQSLVHIWKLNLSKSSIEDVLLIGSVLLDVICFIFQTASTILLRTHKKLFSSVRTKSIPQWGAKYLSLRWSSIK